MKIAAFILAFLGIGNLMALQRVFHQTNDPRWPLTVLACICGLLLLLIAIGILTRWRFVWPLGFAAIAQGCIYFFLSVAMTHPEPDDRVIILTLCGLGGIAVAIYWSVIWYRQKKWFYDNPVA